MRYGLDVAGLPLRVNGPELELVAAVFGDRNLAVVDLEFTASSILEVAVSRLHRSYAGLWSGRVPYFELPWTWLVDPGERINPRVRNVSGITDAEVSGAGSIVEHAPRLARLLADREYLIGWGISNDRPQLERAFATAGVEYDRMLWVDLAKMFHQLHPEIGTNQKYICKLSQACAHYGIPFPEHEQHFAFFDVLATTRLLVAVCDEWLAERDRRHLKIDLSGYSGLAWDPTLLTAPLAPVRWRFIDEMIDWYLHVTDMDLMTRDVAERKRAFFRDREQQEPRGSILEDIMSEEGRALDRELRDVKRYATSRRTVPSGR